MVSPALRLDTVLRQIYGLCLRLILVAREELCNVDIDDACVTQVKQRQA